MSKIICVQVHGQPQPLRITVDKIEITQAVIGDQNILKITEDGHESGQFKDSAVDGWWIEG